MRAGLLRRRVTIEQAGGTRNEYNELETTWSTLATVWAEREDLQGREYFAAQQFKAEVTTRFRIRYRDDVDATMRINDSGKIYNIQSVQDDGRGRETVLMCTKAV